MSAESTTDVAVLDRAMALMMRSFIERGQALHHTELAKALDASPEEGRTVLHDLMASGIPAWLYPDTDYVASFAPFNNQPTQYRVSVGGEQRWFAQCGFEALAITWLFPGQEVTIAAPCLDCGETVQVTVRDGSIVRMDPRAWGAASISPSASGRRTGATVEAA